MCARDFAKPPPDFIQDCPARLRAEADADVPQVGGSPVALGRSRALTVTCKAPAMNETKMWASTSPAGSRRAANQQLARAAAECCEPVVAEEEEERAGENLGEGGVLFLESDERVAAQAGPGEDEDRG